MKIEIARDDLLWPLQRVHSAVERRQSLPILGNVLVSYGPDGLSMTATDLQLELTASAEVACEEAGAFTLPARKFLDIVRAVPEGAGVRLEPEESRVVIRAGRARFTLATLPAEEFPTLGDGQTGTAAGLGRETVRELLRKTQFAMAQQDVRYYLNGLLLELGDGTARAVATDGHRLALCEQPFEGDETWQCILPRKAVTEWLRLLEHADEALALHLGQGQLTVALSGRMRLTSKLVDGRFPDYAGVVPKAGDKVLTVDRGQLEATLRRAAIVSNEKFRGVRCSLAPGELTISSHNPEQEEAEESLDVDYDGAPVEIGFNVTYLLDVLSVLDSEAVRMTLTQPDASALLQGVDEPHCTYVVMPMRL